MRELTDFRDRFDEAARPLTMTEMRARAGRRRARRWTTGAAFCVLVLSGVLVVAANGARPDMGDHGVLVASPQQIDILEGDGPDGDGNSESSGDITTLLRGVDDIVEVERIELVNEASTGIAGLHNLVFSVDTAPVRGAPPANTGESTLVFEPILDGRASVVASIPPQTRVVALLNTVDPSIDGVPDGVTQSLVALLTITEAGDLTFLPRNADDLNDELAQARSAVAFDGTDVDFLVAWIEELAVSLDGGPITEAYRKSQGPETAEWADLPVDERSVEPGTTPPEVMAALQQFQVLVDVGAVDPSVDLDEYSVWVTTELGTHHVANIHNSVGDVWLGAESLPAAEIRAVDGTSRQSLAYLAMPSAPAMTGNQAPTLLIKVSSAGGAFHIDGEWIDAVAARSQLESWVSPAASTPSPESK